MSNDETELQRQLRGVPPEKRPAVACALIGHSRVQSHFWGYWSCERCGEQVGDSLGSSYSARDIVCVGHFGCLDCQRMVGELTWKDTVLLREKAAAFLTAVQQPIASDASWILNVRNQVHNRQAIEALSRKWALS